MGKLSSDKAARLPLLKARYQQLILKQRAEIEKELLEGFEGEGDGLDSVIEGDESSGTMPVVSPPTDREVLGLALSQMGQEQRGGYSGRDPKYKR